MTKSNRKYLLRMIMVVLGLIVLLLIYYFPLQRILAEKKLTEYMYLQGVNTADIRSTEYYKDYTQDGYCVFVRFYGDDYLYVYRYYLFSTGPGHTFQFNTMFCDVYNKENRCMDGFVDGMKYRSLEWVE